MVQVTWPLETFTTSYLWSSRWLRMTLKSVFCRYMLWKRSVCQWVPIAHAATAVRIFRLWHTVRMVSWKLSRIPSGFHCSKTRKLLKMLRETLLPHVSESLPPRILHVTFHSFRYIPLYYCGKLHVTYRVSLGTYPRCQPRRKGDCSRCYQIHFRRELTSIRRAPQPCVDGLLVTPFGSRLSE